MSTPTDNESDFTKLDDAALIGERARVREQLECLSPNSADRAPLAGVYEKLIDEFDRRARAAWQQSTPSGKAS